MGSRAAAEAKALAVAEELERMRLGEAVRVVRGGCGETLTYTGFPREHWRRIRTAAIKSAEPRGPKADPRGGNLPGGRGSLRSCSSPRGSSTSRRASGD